MIKHYPEIDKFFLSDSFTDEELDAFKATLKIKYDDLKYSQALSLVNLILRKFEIASGIEIEEYREEARKRILRAKNGKINSDKGSPVKEASIKSKRRPSNKKQLHQYEIEEFCRCLEVSLDLVNRVLRKSNLGEIHSGTLSEEQLKALSEMIEAKEKAITRRKKANKKVLGKRASVTKKPYNSGKGVYGEISRLGMGKVIYIRSK